MHHLQRWCKGILNLVVRTPFFVRLAQGVFWTNPAAAPVSLRPHLCAIAQQPNATPAEPGAGGVPWGHAVQVQQRKWRRGTKQVLFRRPAEGAGVCHTCQRSGALPPPPHPPVPSLPSASPAEKSADSSLVARCPHVLNCPRKSGTGISEVLCTHPTLVEGKPHPFWQRRFCQPFFCVFLALGLFCKCQKSSTLMLFAPVPHQLVYKWSGTMVILREGVIIWDGVTTGEMPLAISSAF